MTTSQENQSTKNTSTKSDSPFVCAPRTSTAIEVLFDVAYNHLDIDELNYLARMNEHASLISEGLSGKLMALGVLFGGAEKHCLPNDDGLADIFFDLSHTLDHVKGLIYLASEADRRIKELKEQELKQNNGA